MNITAGRGYTIGGNVNITAGNSDNAAGDITITPGYSDSANHGEVLIQTNTNYFRFNRDGQFTMPSGASIVSSNFTGADGENAVLGQYDGHTQVYTMQNGVGIQTHDSGSYSTWNFGSTGDLTLPEGGDILDYLGNSVLSGISMTEVTHSEILDLIDSSSLIEGRFYKITDYKTCYDQPDFDYNGSSITEGNYKVGPTQSVVVWALSSNALSVDAWQPDYPNDKIKYDVFWTSTEVTEGTAYGRIIERIDDNNNLEYHGGGNDEWRLGLFLSSNQRCMTIGSGSDPGKAKGVSFRSGRQTMDNRNKLPWEFYFYSPLS